MNRKSLIEKYLTADSTPAEERALLESFNDIPPRDKEEAAALELLQAIEPIEIKPLPEAEEEFDTLLRHRKVRKPLFWASSIAGVAAAIAAIVLFTGRPSEPMVQDPGTTDYSELIQQLAFISNFNPTEADNLEFKPVGDGFVMTAHFPDGQSASFLLTPLDGGTSFNLISLNK